MKIDAHHHFWKFDPVRNSWIAESMSVLKRDFLPRNFSAILKDNHIDGTVTVQADQSIEETDFLLDMAIENEFVKGVVGWIDLQSEYLELQLDKYVDLPILKGIRHLAQSEPNDFLSRGQ